MLSINRTKELLNNQSISDKKAEKIRDSFRMLAEIIFEKWYEEKMKARQKFYPQTYVLLSKANIVQLKRC